MYWASGPALRKRVSENGGAGNVRLAGGPSGGGAGGRGGHTAYTAAPTSPTRHTTASVRFAVALMGGMITHGPRFARTPPGLDGRRSTAGRPEDRRPGAARRSQGHRGVGPLPRGR